MLIFFFSSRRRHTRYWRDWSSDVCSSDLRAFPRDMGHSDRRLLKGRAETLFALARGRQGARLRGERSEERRVGKECRSFWEPNRYEIIINDVNNMSMVRRVRFMISLMKLA